MTSNKKRKKEKSVCKYTSVYQTKAYAYAYDVVEGNIVACKDVINSCQRFIDDLQKAEFAPYAYYFDLEIYEDMEKAIGKFKFAGGEKTGTQIELVPPQDFVVANLFCWRYKNNEEKRRFRSSMVMIPRKNAKTFDCALISILAMRDEAYGECYSAASKYSQASLSFKQCANIIKTNSKIARKFKINKAEITFKKNESIFMPMSSDYKSLDGVSPNFVLLDEAFVMDPGVRDSMTSGFGQRLSPLAVAISTAYDVSMTGNWAYDEMVYTKKVNSGEIENDRHFGIIYSLDDEDDVHDKEKWEMANPLMPYVETLKEDLEEEYNKAIHNNKLMRNFKIKRMNLILDGTDIEKYIHLPTWNCNAVPFIDFKDKWAFYGVDLSINTDLTGVIKCIYDPVEDSYLFKAHAFLPKERVEELEARDQIPYRQYAEEGHCTLCEGFVVEYEDVVKYIQEDQDNGINTAMVAYDPYNSEYLLNRCNELGINTFVIRQGFNQLSGPTKLFRTYTYKGNIIHEFNPIFTWCARNAITAKDRFGNEILDKVKAVEKIDLMAAAIFAFKACDKEKWNYVERVYDESYVV